MEASHLKSITARPEVVQPRNQQQQEQKKGEKGGVWVSRPRCRRGFRGKWETKQIRAQVSKPAIERDLYDAVELVEKRQGFLQPTLMSRYNLTSYRMNNSTVVGSLI
ncbi:hypothetical protein I7I51_02293 [Histoplasma capsulatum]|uniref:Uncharacterized protein n=1 Tax=Ajellomyces capsulatus TaxID=5037 RepID=A0A8A1M9W4_AJECA|nr:hypothetical protein I7I51_02293 [Histoplasma capsulatum]